ncbi:MAG: hypothetical protein AB4038_07490 [Prochloraceae cyanobacterium]
MKTEQITPILVDIFDSSAVEQPSTDSWQVDTDQMRLLIILSQDYSWLRLLVPIAPAKEAQPFLQELLESNFDLTQQVRYALNQEVLWVVFHHSFESLLPEDLRSAIFQAISLREKGLSELFNQQIERRVRQIIKAAKLQGQTLENTLQNIERLYREGMLGGLQQESQQREQFIAAWQYQLRRLWSEVEISD